MSGFKYKDKEQEQDEDNSFDVGYVLPETKSILNTLGEELRAAHEQEAEEDEKQGKPKKQRKRGTICCCGMPGCSIGPMMETEKEE